MDIVVTAQGKAVPILAEREEALAILLRDRLVARSEYLEVKRRLVEARHEIAATEAELERASADVAKAGPTATRGWPRPSPSGWRTWRRSASRPRRRSRSW